MKKFEAESGVPFSAQASSNTTGTVDTWRDIYLVAGRAGVAVGSSLALVVVLIVNATDAPVTIGGLLQLFLILGLGLSIFFSFAFYTGAVSRFERRTGIDYNKDGKLGNKPIEPATTIRVEWKERDQDGNLKEGGNDTWPSGIREMAAGFVAGHSLAEAHWTGRGKPFSQDEYRAIRDQLMGRGFAYWVNPKSEKQGWDLNVAGKSFMRRLAEDN